MLTVNSKAPDFSAPDQNDLTHTLADYRGQWLLLYFYPKDDTPGCTKEACTIQENFPDFTQLNIAVLGVSKDTVKSHAKFATKYNLTFPLLADPNRTIIKAYQAQVNKKMFGKTYLGTARVSYLIRPDGTIAKTYDKVNPTTHAQQLLQDIKQLQTQ